MYLRFVIHKLDPDSGRRVGLFQAMAELWDEGRLFDYQVERYQEIGAWFSVNLKVPSSFSRSSKPNAKNVAIGWFKSSATEHIALMREAMTILDSHGIAVEVLRSERPGFIVYEDDHQVAAEPFKDTAT